MLARLPTAVGVLLALVVASRAPADPSNQIFEDRALVDPARDGDLALELVFLGFLENNEYGNDIADGYTLFGARMTPRLVYFHGPHARLEAGATLWHLFGDTEGPQLDPYLRLKLQVEDIAIVFGSLEGQLTHRMIEPLFDYELHITRPYETGAQVRYETKRVFADLWIDWVTLIRPRDPFQEMTRYGLSTSFTVIDHEFLSLRIPMQWTAVHEGGTIDRSPKPLRTTFNAALGFAARLKLGGFVRTVHTENYLVGYTDASMSYEPLYQRGGGVYLNLGVDLETLGSFELVYWRGAQFINPMGGALFSSASRRVNQTVPGLPRRELLLLRLTNDIRIGRGVFLSLRAEPYVDLRSGRPEFSTGLYVGLNEQFAITNLR